MTGARRPHAQVFAVEDDRAQLVVRDQSGIRCVEVEGLAPGVRQQVLVDGHEVTVTTLRPPPGAVRSRIATLSDLHLGSTHHFGVRDEPGTAVPYPLRCARAALAEALDWGAEAIILKGDLTQHARPAEWEQLGELIDGIPVPVGLLIGNHETPDRAHLDARKALADLGRPFDDVAWLDVPGARVVLVDSTVPRRGFGRLAHIHEHAVATVGATDGPVVVMLHHHLERSPVPLAYPIGVPRAQAQPFLRDLRAANPAVFVTSGHSHRNRARTHLGVPVTQVGSVKDYPGVWAGYVIHDGGIRQVVRRVATEDCLTFTERTAEAIGGLWGRWTPGQLSDRCLVHQWP